MHKLFTTCCCMPGSSRPEGDRNETRNVKSGYLLYLLQSGSRLGDDKPGTHVISMIKEIRPHITTRAMKNTRR